MGLSHVNEQGQARMVDVSEKPISERFASAEGEVKVLPSTYDAIIENRLIKGDVLAAARIAGIMAAKRCDELIPLCHTIPLSDISIDLQPLPDPPRVEIRSSVRCYSRTGAEMEALLAVSIAALTIYDMVKAIDRKASITNICLMEKSGGKSGHFLREEDEE